jgi:uncharacterized membrane protein (UPF0127 family)
MKKFILFVLVFFVTIVFYLKNSPNLTLSSNGAEQSAFRKVDFANKVKINNTVFDTNFTDDIYERNLGFSNVEKVDENQAMLFIFEDPSIETFWMKDMNFDLDILWIDENFKILKIDKNVSKNGYDKNHPNLSEKLHSPAPVKYVLEIPAGNSEKNKIKIGDKIEISK